MEDKLKVLGPRRRRENQDDDSEDTTPCGPGGEGPGPW